MDGANKRPREAIEPAPGVAAVARVVSAAAVPAFDASAAKVLATGQRSGSTVARLCAGAIVCSSMLCKRAT